MGESEGIEDSVGRSFVALLRARWATEPRAERPCQGCRTQCPCTGSRSCTCACTPACAEAPARILPGQTISGAGLRLALELGSMRGVTLCAPCPESSARLLIRTEGCALPALIADALDALERRGRMKGRWMLRVVPYQCFETAYALEPVEGSASAAELTEDLALLGESLGGLLCKAVDKALDGVAPTGAAALSDREAEILLAFIDGLGVKSMAQRFHLSPHTVRNHLKALYEKLGVHSQTELRELFVSGAMARAS